MFVRRLAGPLLHFKESPLFKTQQGHLSLIPKIAESLRANRRSLNFRQLCTLSTEGEGSELLLDDADNSGQDVKGEIITLQNADSGSEPSISESSSQEAIQQQTGREPRHTYRAQGVFKAVLLGEVGSSPVQKTLKSGHQVTLFTLKTSGLRNYRRPLEGETASDYAKRSTKQWHRVAVYQYNIGNWAMQFVKEGAQLYVEGNLEMRIFNDPTTGQMKQIREISVRRNGRVMFMGYLPKRPGQ